MFSFAVPASAFTVKKTFRGNKKKVPITRAAITGTSAVDTVNIREMVLRQIEAARKNTPVNVGQALLRANAVKKAGTEKASPGFWVNLRKAVPLSWDVLEKILIIFGFSLFVFGIIFIRRLFSKKIFSKSGGKEKELKKNISLIREEKPVKIKDKNKLRSIRSKLIKNYSAKELNDENLSRKARELKIAEGELMLAERIKMHGMAGSYEGKK